MSQSDGNQDRNGELGRLADRELIRRFAEHRDQKAFRLLVDRHGGLVFGVCRRILCHHHDAEDAFQATFLVLARKAGRGGWHESLANWLYGTAARIALKDGSARRRQEEHTMKAEPTVEPAAFDELARSHARRTLDEELSQLPDRYRAPLVLCYLEGKTRDQAAEELGCSLGTVKGRLERGRHELRLRLLRRGIGVTLPAVAGGLVLSSAGAAQASVGPASAAVPQTLALSTVEAATAFAVGGSLSGAVTSQSLALAKGELAMLSSATFMKQAATAAVALAVLSVTYLLFSGDAAAKRPEKTATATTYFPADPAGEVSLPPGLFALAAQAEHDEPREGNTPSGSSDEHSGDRGAADLSRMQGKWSVKRYVSDGNEVPKASLENAIVIIDGNHVTARADRHFTSEFKFDLEPRTKPGQVDIRPDEPGGQFFYKIAGNRLTVQSKKFGSDGRAPTYLFVLERAKPQKEDVPFGNGERRSGDLKPPTDGAAQASALQTRTANDAEETPADRQDDPRGAKLVGRWVGGELRPHLLILNADGTFRQTTYEGQQGAGTWKLAGRVLQRRFTDRIPAEAAARALSLSVTVRGDDVLQLVVPAVDETRPPKHRYLYRRIPEEHALPDLNWHGVDLTELPKQARALVGTWQRGSFFAVSNETFLPDGTFISTNNFEAPSIGTWELKGKELHLRAEPGMLLERDQVETTRTLLEVNDSKVVYRERERDNPLLIPPRPNRDVDKGSDGEVYKRVGIFAEEDDSTADDGEDS